MKLQLNQKKIDECRKISAAIAGDVGSMIQKHSTVAIERSCLRILGIEGAMLAEDQQSFPLVNIVVDKIQAEGGLQKGAMYWIAKACLAHKQSPQKIAESIAQNKLSFQDLPKLNEQDIQAKALELAQSGIQLLVDKRKERNQIIASTKDPHDPQFLSTPLKYVIVASGNIFEDTVQARSAAQAGADVIAVIRSTAQSLLDFVPDGATTEGFGGTYATQENFKIIRKALDEESKNLGRYVRLTNYASGLCMPEISSIAAIERLDFLLCDSLYGILFRDINMKRTLIDQHFSRLICALSEIFINTGEDNYLTTADAIENGHQVLASDFINERLAIDANMKKQFMGLGHAMEMNPWTEDVILLEMARAQMTRDIFPDAPLKYMPPTKYMEGDIFFSHVYDAIFNLVGVTTRQGIQLLGMPTEAMHTPLLMDRFQSLKATKYVFDGAKNLHSEIEFKKDGRINKWAEKVLDESLAHLKMVQEKGMFQAIEEKAFAEISRTLTGGKGYKGVFERGEDYCNPIQTILEEQNYEQ